MVDQQDVFPLDKSEQLDSDGDGVGDNADADDDEDGVDDTADAFPLDKTESHDMDGDRVGDNTDPDIDGDGVARRPFSFLFASRSLQRALLTPQRHPGSRYRCGSGA